MVKHLEKRVSSKIKYESYYILKMFDTIVRREAVIGFFK